MTTMIERVATALHEKACEQDVCGYLDAKIDCVGLAIAAIEAMREPTEEMCSAYDWHDSWSYVVEAPTATQAWQTMIDVALKAKQ